jgi:hypothetical protein
MVRVSQEREERRNEGVSQEREERRNEYPQRGFRIQNNGS